MAGIASVRDDIHQARTRRSGHADGKHAVTRAEAIAIVARATAAGVSAGDIRQAFHDAGDNGFGAPMTRYLDDYEIVRMIGVDAPPSVTLPGAPELSLDEQDFSSTYGGITLELRPQPGDDTVVVRASTQNPFPHSSGPGETPLVYGRDGLFDQVLLRLYGYPPRDPLSDTDLARAAVLTRDSRIARARRRFIEAGPGTVELELPRRP
ncbi:hypothetical protein [Haliangium sp.]|uniref:hypothetical protein n=1 Tax=Haliangium sp. TaxID=2663208 RepID=UPI003D0A0759